ncbi:hypothetical protein F7725_003919 [Dissostichus mawsoni]|uniref:Uncharacterized protein n=1 Tax=Dissostichus mawsoni TaxID=36200 RepID=A0A7J5YCW9_DISMA|nr:hypothetical protein F7725_003919 [Dissostichus mawsoni]
MLPRAICSGITLHTASFSFSSGVRRRSSWERRDKGLCCGESSISKSRSPIMSCRMSLLVDPSSDITAGSEVRSVMLQSAAPETLAWALISPVLLLPAATATTTTGALALARASVWAVKFFFLISSFSRVKRRSMLARWMESFISFFLFFFSGRIPPSCFFRRFFITRSSPSFIFCKQLNSDEARSLGSASGRSSRTEGFTSPVTPSPPVGVTFPNGAPPLPPPSPDPTTETPPPPPPSFPQVTSAASSSRRRFLLDSCWGSEPPASLRPVSGGTSPLSSLSGGSSGPVLCGGLMVLPAGNCWMGTDGTATPSDQSATSGCVNSAAGALHSPWNSSFPTAFSAAACSSFSIWDGDVHVSQWRVGVAQSDGGDVDVGSLSQWLMVGTGVCDEQEAGLPESSLDLIGEGTGGEAPVEGGGAVFLEEMTHTSAGFSMATMALAASRSFSQVFFRLTMYTPGTYWSIWKSKLVPPRWVDAARNLRTSSSFI